MTNSQANASIAFRRGKRLMPGAFTTASTTASTTVSTTTFANLVIIMRSSDANCIHICMKWCQRRYVQTATTNAKWSKKQHITAVFLTPAVFTNWQSLSCLSDKLYGGSFDVAVTARVSSYMHRIIILDMCSFQKSCPKLYGILTYLAIFGHQVVFRSATNFSMRLVFQLGLPRPLCQGSP